MVSGVIDGYDQEKQSMKKKILTIVFSIGVFGAGVGVGAVAVANVLSNIIEEYRTSSDKFLRMFQKIIGI